jgi:serine/threonine-protein kinase
LPLTTMALAPGTRLGAYEIVGLVGAGGMGEVYRAIDTRLDRHVALKVLPDTVATDPERNARFQREAKVLASLNHPHIAALFGLEEDNHRHFLAMELVEGETLADRIARGALPVEEALPIARQIAEGLEAAHEHGIIHRDLKPANVKVRPDGTVKVLDFGLAKALATEVSRPSALLTNSPTITSPLGMTGVGVLLGTAAYMSPEQAAGKGADKRSDIWAFGVVVLEMLTGRAAFEGETVSHVLAAVLRDKPDWTRLPAATPPAIRRLLRRCLEKDQTRRLASAADARLEIDDALTPRAGDVGDTSVPARRLPRWRRALLPALALVTAALLAGTLVWQADRPGPPHVTRTAITLPVAPPLTLDAITRDVAIAADGSKVVYVGANGTSLFVRPLDQLAPIALTGLGAQPRHPIFSPDGQWIAFFNGTGELRKVATSGGPPIPLNRGGNNRGASWSADGTTILFATADVSTGLLRVSAGGGEAEVLTRPDPAAGEIDHWWPEVLPGGQATLFTITTPGRIDEALVALLDLRTGEKKVLVRGGFHAQYVAPGYLVYGVSGTLRAVAFDLARRAVMGTPVPVVESVITTPLGAADASVSADGTLVYVVGDTQFGSRRTLVWVDRQGHEESLGTPARAYLYPSLSPDGTQVAVAALDEEQDIWNWDISRRQLTRITYDPALDLYPVWTRDGRLLWSSGRSGPLNIYAQKADGTGPIQRLTTSPASQFPYGLTPDGKQVVLREDGAGTGADLSLLTLEDGRVVPLLHEPFHEQNGELSPNGQWLAYESMEGGKSEIVVRPFPAVTEGRFQVSTGGGRQPLWARNGRELFYRGPDGAVLGIQVDVGQGRAFRHSSARTLVPGRYVDGGGAFVGRSYDVSPDGKRFLMIKEESAESGQTARPPSIVMIQNWTRELKRLVPTN